MGVDQIEGVVCKRKVLAVSFLELTLEPLLLEVRARQFNRRRGEIYSRDDRAAARESRQVGAGPAPDLEDPLAAPSIEVDQAQQVMQLLEMVLIQIAEEPRRPDGMRGDLEIVNMVIPVRTNVGCGRGSGGWHGIFTIK